MTPQQTYEEGVKQALEEIKARCQILELGIDGFKGLKNFKLSFPTKLSIVIGPNGSGKTSLIEALELLRDILEYRKGRLANPFIKWWGYKNVVWLHKEDQPITYTLKLKVNTDNLRKGRKLLPDLNTSEATYEYKLIVYGAGGTPHIIEEAILPELGLKLKFEGNKATLTILSSSMFKERFLNVITSKARARAVRSVAFFRSKAKTELRQIFIPLFLYLQQEVEVPRNIGQYNEQDITSIVDDISSRLTELLANEVNGLGFVTEGLTERYLDLIKGVKKESYLPSDLENRMASLLSSITERMLGGLNLEIMKIERDVYKFLLIMVADKLHSELCQVLDQMLDLFSAVVMTFIDNMVILKNVNHDDLRSPQPLLEAQSRLKSSASNIAPLLFKVTGGRVPEEFTEALRAVLDADSVAISFDLTADGRVMFKFNVDGLDLLPPSIPGGVWKALAVEAALYFRPSLLAIDEFENSLHVSAQGYLLDEIRSSGVTALITTHSPTVIDLAKSLEEIVVFEREGAVCRARRIKDHERLKEKLQELGLLPSEALLYGFIEE